MKTWGPVLTLFALCVLAARSVSADGKAYSGRDYSSLMPIVQGEQRAAIVHREGIERLIIAVSLELEEEDKAVWIFPVPGTPEQTKLDVVDSFPQFSGTDAHMPARNVIGSFIDTVRATQIYPLALLFVTTAGRAGAGMGVFVQEKIEKWGIHAEAVTADSLQSFAQYLEAKDIGIPEEELSAFDPYLSDQYVLVVVWIASREELLKEFPDYGERRYLRNQRWPCVYVEFPTERAFYPLRPTRTYGVIEIPVRLAVVGYVQPETDASLANRIHVSYYEQHGFAPGTPQVFIEDLPKRPIRYTTVRILGTAAWAFTDDLWFMPVDPPSVKHARTIEALGRPLFAVPLWIMVVAGLSYVSAGLSGLALYGRWRGYAKLGLWNLLTLPALMIALFVVRGQNGKRLPKTRIFTLTFTFIFILLTVLVKSWVLAPVG